jgi:hypothetical protein
MDEGALKPISEVKMSVNIYPVMLGFGHCYVIQGEG